MVLAAAAMWVPWSVRSSVFAGRLVLVQGASAVNFYLPTRYEWDQGDERTLWPRFAKDPYGVRLNAASTPAEMAEADRLGFRLALDNVAANPFHYLASRARTVPHLFLTSFDDFTGINRSFGTVITEGRLQLLFVKVVLLVVFSLVTF